MGVQVIGERKRQLAEERTGLHIDRLLRLTNLQWEARVLTPDGHEHWTINPQTWVAELDRDPIHWTSCNV